MDVFRPAEIPADYTFLYFTNDYIDFYNVADANNRNVEYYRYFYKIPALEHKSRWVGNYSTHLGDYHKTTDSIIYSPYFMNILIVSFIIIVFVLFVFNQLSCIVKRGGVFSSW